MQVEQNPFKLGEVVSPDSIIMASASDHREAIFLLQRGPTEVYSPVCVNPDGTPGSTPVVSRITQLWRCALRGDPAWSVVRSGLLLGVLPVADAEGHLSSGVNFQYQVVISGVLQMCDEVLLSVVTAAPKSYPSWNSFRHVHDCMGIDIVRWGQSKLDFTAIMAKK